MMYPCKALCHCKIRLERLVTTVWMNWLNPRFQSLRSEVLLQCSQPRQDVKQFEDI